MSYLFKQKTDVNINLCVFYGYACTFSHIGRHRMILPLIGSSAGLTRLHRLLPFLRFSTLYPKMLVPPVLVGADQARLMQSLKALMIFGVEGCPGYA